MSTIAVCGGGIAGLACAYRLASEGRSVVLFEGSDRLGGLGTHFEHDGQRIERFYHVMLDSDSHLLPLVRELGLGPKLTWKHTGMGFYVDGRHYAFNTALDLLCFGALSLPDRIRTGLGALYLTKMVNNGLPLDEELAVDWLRRVFGARVFTRIWEPLLTAKFGDQRGVVPAYWVWNLLRREKDGGEETKAYVVGGYHSVADALADRILACGGRIVTNAPVSAVEADADGVTLTLPGGRERFHTAVSTLPLPLLHRIARGPLRERLPGRDLSYQGVVNVVVLLRRRLAPHYWTAVMDERFPFQGVVETTHVIPPDSVGGWHVVYVLNYCGPGSPLYDEDDGRLGRKALEGLERVYPDFDRREAEAVYVFRAPHVEPVWTRGYLKKRPAPRVDGTRLYLCTTAQAYPMVTAWNTSVKLATEVTNSIRGDLA